jgi:uncharacterized small protein (DUF1192 family)
VTDFLAAYSSAELLALAVDTPPILTLKRLAARIAELETEIARLRDAAPF